MTNVLVPSIGMRHHALQLPEDTCALLILDGCYAHSKEILMALQEHHIAFHFLPPHSSHITQPLDWGIFSSLNSFFKMTHYDGIENSVAKRIMHGLIALQQMSHFASI